MGMEELENVVSLREMQTLPHDSGRAFLYPHER